MPLPHCDWFVVKCVHPAVYQWYDPLFTCSEFCSGCSYPHDYPCEFCIVFELEGLEIVSTPLFFVRLTRSPTWFNTMNDIWPGECTFMEGNWKGWEKLGMKEHYGWWSSSFFSLWQTFVEFLHAFNPLSPNSDQHQNFFLTVSVHCQEIRLWELTKWLPKRKCLDLWTNSLNSFFNEMYGDQVWKICLWILGLKGLNVLPSFLKACCTG